MAVFGVLVQELPERGGYGCQGDRDDEGTQQEHDHYDNGAEHASERTCV